MRLKFYLMTAALLLLSGFLDVSAEKIIQIEMSDANVAPTEVAVAEISRIQFAAGSFSVKYLQNDATAMFNYAQVKRITFKDDSAIATTQATNKMVVVNPVRENLLLKGGDALYGTDINIYSMTGTLVMQVAAWAGDAINVSHLTPGVYIINTQFETLKFVKL